MNATITLMKRELASYFYSPIAYVMLFIFLFTSGMAFGLEVFVPGGDASLRALFLGKSWMLVILAFVLPLLTMRLVSEELRVGTIETLMTAPITEYEVILGKYLGALFFFVVMLLATLIYPAILSMYGRLDLLLLASHFLGSLLLGSLFISVGLFFSTCTRHQLIAAMLTMVLLAIFTFASGGLAQQTEGSIRRVLHHFSITDHLVGFGRGIVELNHVVFFLTTTFFFLFLAAKWLEMKRWR